MSSSDSASASCAFVLRIPSCNSATLPSLTFKAAEESVAHALRRSMSFNSTCKTHYFVPRCTSQCAHPRKIASVCWTRMCYSNWLQSLAPCKPGTLSGCALKVCTHAYSQRATLHFRTVICSSSPDKPITTLQDKVPLLAGSPRSQENTHDPV
jgi:hypothetical protein